jgi:hypothetical protein
MRLFFVSILILALTPCQAQSTSNKLSADLTNFSIGAHVGPYRGRTADTDGPFNEGVSLVGQVYFPFQLSFGMSNDTTSKNNEYANKIVLIRPSVILHFIDNGSIAYGSGAQISFKTFNQIYLEYQFGVVHLDAKEGASPDLYDGTNLHHFVSLSKALNHSFTASLGFIHLSKGGFNSKTSNQDMITLGIRFHL